jgi:hypothetical protein
MAHSRLLQRADDDSANFGTVEDGPDFSAFVDLEYFSEALGLGLTGGVIVGETPSARLGIVIGFDAATDSGSPASEPDESPLPWLSDPD